MRVNKAFSNTDNNPQSEWWSDDPRVLLKYREKQTNYYHYRYNLEKNGINVLSKRMTVTDQFRRFLHILKQANHQLSFYLRNVAEYATDITIKKNWCRHANCRSSAHYIPQK